MAPMGVRRGRPCDLVRRWALGPATHAVVLALATSCLAPVSRAAASGDAAVRADTLYRRALAQLSEPSLEARRAALAAFEEATRLAPGRADLWLARGRADLQCGRFSQGRD